MPVKSCRSDGKPGYKWGDSGKCYTYTPDDEESRKRARAKAEKQGRAIQENERSFDESIRLAEAQKQPDDESSRFAVWNAVAIAAGMSANHILYPPEILKEHVDKFEGVPVYEYSESEHQWGNASVESLAGYFRSAEFKSDEIQGEIALLKTSKAVEKLEAFTSEAEAGHDVERAMPKLSIHGSGPLRFEVEEATGTGYAVLESITEIRSVDVVINAAAGGKFGSKISEAIMNYEQKVEFLKSQHPDIVEGVEVTEENIDELLIKAASKTVTAAESGTTTPEKNSAAVSEEGEDRIAKLERQIFSDRSQARVERALAEAVTLPDKSRARVRSLAEAIIASGKEVSVEDAQKFVAEERSILAEAVQSNVGRGNRSGSIVLGDTEGDRYGIAFERMLFGDNTGVIQNKLSEADPGSFDYWKNIPAFASLHEALRHMCGIEPHEISNMDSIRTTQPVTIHSMNRDGTLAEAMQTSDFTKVLENLMTKRMLKEYARPDKNYWRRIVNIVPVRDLKQQSRLRLGGFGNLPTVAERAPYTDLQDLSEEKVTYTPTKQGGTASVTLEMLINDDLGAFRRLPTKLGLSAAETILEFVESFITDNPVVYDGNNLFDATNHGDNTAVAGLSATNLFTGWRRMMEQVETVTTTGAGSNEKRLNIRPRFLLVAPEECGVAYELTTVAAGEYNAVPTFEQSLRLTPLVMETLTDTDAWYLVADPTIHDTIEIGFLAGQDAPAIVKQGAETEGEMFARDAITWKVRWFFGGAVAEWRSFYAGIPA